MGSAGALCGIVVLERASRLATAVCGSLLAGMGATVVRAESPEATRLVAAGTATRQALLAGGKQRVRHDPREADAAARWRRLAARADAVLLDTADLAPAEAAFLDGTRSATRLPNVVCVISPLGLAAPGLAATASELLLQAASGVMATTGLEGGAPECVGLPLTEMCAGIASATAVLAALRVRAAAGFGQLVDMSIVETMADQLRTHLPLVMAGKADGYRIGCRHPVSAPWNCYRAADCWVLICSASDEQWHALLDLVGRPELKADPRFAKNVGRHEHIDAVDAVIGDWVAARPADEVVAALERIDVPVGRASTIPEMLASPMARRRGMASEQRSEDGTAFFLPGAVARLGRTPPALPGSPSPVEPDADRAIAALGARPPASLSSAAVATLPLAGIRVVELTRYTAGPLAGRILGSLGAEVFKVETRAGEDCRSWSPQFGGVSGFFANFNAGKRSLALDLRSAEDRAALDGLLATSDVVLQNFKGGSLERLGLGAEAVTRNFPRLVYCAISGYGDDGPQFPALDTVIQAKAGLTSLIGNGEQPLRVGVSVADFLSGNFAAFGILAALEERRRSGRGQIVDISMYDAAAWLTQLAWPDGRSAIGPWTVIEGSDGWVAADATLVQARAALAAVEHRDLSTDALASRLQRAGISAARVLELDEVVNQRAHRARQTLYRAPTAEGEGIPILSLPFGLQATPPLRSVHVAALGADNGILARTGLPASPPAGSRDGDATKRAPRS